MASPPWQSCGRVQEMECRNGRTFRLAMIPRGNHTPFLARLSVIYTISNCYSLCAYGSHSRTPIPIAYSHYSPLLSITLPFLLPPHSLSPFPLCPSLSQPSAPLLLVTPTIARTLGYSPAPPTPWPDWSVSSDTTHSSVPSQIRLHFPSPARLAPHAACNP